MVEFTNDEQTNNESYDLLLLLILLVPLLFGFVMFLLCISIAVSGYCDVSFIL